MSKENSGMGTFLTGLFLGGLAGAVITLLNAPRSGEETRAQLRERGMELRDTAEQKMEEYLTQGRALLDESQKQLAKASEEVKQIASDAISEVRTAAVEAGKESKETAQEAVEETTQAAAEAR